MAVWVDIANAMKALIQPIANMPTVYIRKVDAVHHEELPCCVLSFGTENYDTLAHFGNGTAGSRGGVGKEFGIVLTLYEKNLAATDTGLTTTTELFASVIAALDLTRLPGITSQWDCRIETNEAWVGVSFGKGYQQSGLIFWAKVVEERN